MIMKFIISTHLNCLLNLKFNSLFLPNKLFCFMTTRKDSCKTLDKLTDGELVTIDSKGNVTKSTLSKTDKANVLKNLQKLNGNGLSPKQQTQEDKKKKIYCL